MGELEVIEALCCLVERAVAVIRDEQTKEALLREQGSAAGAGTGLSNYNAVKNNIMLYASRGMTGVANRLIQQAWGQLSAAQQSDLAATMRQNGWTS